MVGAKRQRNVENLSGLLDRLAEQTTAIVGAGETVRVGALLEAVGRRAYGPLLLAIGLFAISPATVVPGLTWATAIVTFVIAAQLAIGMKRPWVPHQALDVAVSKAPLDKAIRALRPWAARIDKVVRPRFVALADPPWVNLAGVLAMGAAVVTIPLGFIPFAPFVPGLAIVLLGLGVTARDGLLLSYGAVAMVGAGWLVWGVAQAALK
jgi:hypothetical protein